MPRPRRAPSFRRPRLLLLMLVGLVVAIIVAIPLPGEALPAWGSLDATNPAGTTVPASSLAPQRERGAPEVAAKRSCKALKNPKRRKQCRKKQARERSGDDISQVPTSPPAPSAPEPQGPAPVLPPVPTPTPVPPPDAVLLAAGDIARCTRTGDEATAALLDELVRTELEVMIAALGDLAYESGSIEEFRKCYAPSWGRHKSRTRPAVGNHEYLTEGASGYFGYFGAAATPLDPNCRNSCRGYYSYDLGAWHIVVLNTNCTAAGGCRAGSEQEQWLRADLAAHPTACTLAYWHYPRYSFDLNPSLGDDPRSQALWQALYEHGAEVVLTGHAHNYQRYTPLDATGTPDPMRGIRQFVVGTGGANFTPLGTQPPTAEVGNDDTFGLLQLTLHPTSYAWEFIPVAGQSFTDSGNGVCH